MSPPRARKVPAGRKTRPEVDEHASAPGMADSVPAQTVVVPASMPQGKPLEPPEAPPAETWFRSIMTDADGFFDLGAVLVGVVVVFMCLNSGYDTTVLRHSFDAMNFGSGVGAVLFGFAAYKFGTRNQGGAYRPPMPPPRGSARERETFEDDPHG